VQLFLIRHPAPRIDPGICYGRSDLALAADVAAAAARIRPQLPAGLPVFSSPLQRCRLLAQALHAQPVFDDRLLEMHFGAWEMTAWHRIQREALDGWAADPLGYAPPGGESVGALQSRVLDLVAQLAAGPLPAAALVAHAGVMKVLVGWRRGLPTREWMSLSFAFEAVVELDLPDGEPEAQARSRMD